MFSEHQILRISPLGPVSIATAVRVEEKQTPDMTPGGEKCPRPNVPDPLCGAMWLAGGRVSDPRPLSCTFFDPSVHLSLSVLRNSLDGTHRPHAFDTTASAVSGGLLPSG